MHALKKLTAKDILEKKKVQGQQLRLYDDYLNKYKFYQNAKKLM